MGNLLSLTDAAPAVVTLEHGEVLRIPGLADYRVLAALQDSIDGFDSLDAGVTLAYCSLHTTPAEIAKLWTAARKPKKLYETIVAWMAAADPEALGRVMDAVSAFDAEMQEEVGGDGEESGKKKRRPRHADAVRNGTDAPRSRNGVLVHTGGDDFASGEGI